MKSKSLEISIVGAGIGGLVAALALKKRGHLPIIYEKAESLSELGAGIQLSPNANKVLKHLGVMEELQADVYEPEAFQFVHYRTGKVLAQQALKNSSVKIYGSPNYDIHRADLQKALLKIINKQEIQIVKNSEIFKDIGYAFRVTFLNKCDDAEKNTIAEYLAKFCGFKW